MLASGLDNPAAALVRVSNGLRKQGVFVSPSGVRSIWLRHDLEIFRKRLAALERKMAAEGIVLAENQVAALELKHRDVALSGEIEPPIPATSAPSTPSSSAT